MAMMTRYLVIAQSLLYLFALFHSATGSSSSNHHFSLEKKSFGLRRNTIEPAKAKTVTEIRGGEGEGVFRPRGWGDHPIITPAKRWTWCAAYWAVCAVAAKTTGKIDFLINQEWKAINPLYAVHLVMLNSLGLASWDWSAFAFERPFRVFSTIVYPLFHILDALAWYVVYDASKFILNKVLGLVGINDVSKVIQWLFGVAVLGGGYITFHRSFFELRCLPEHHPEPSPEGRGLKIVYVVGLAVCAFPMFAIYEWYGDMRFGVLTRYAADLYFAIRMRLSNPWDDYGEEDKDYNKARWLPDMKGY